MIKRIRIELANKQCTNAQTLGLAPICIAVAATYSTKNTKMDRSCVSCAVSPATAPFGAGRSEGGRRVCS